MPQPLPIDEHTSHIAALVQENPITIIEAPPGTGKTTRVAPALMQLPMTQGKRLYLLQPRRIAAKSVAERIAWERGCKVGEQIGYQVRFDSQVTRQTQLVVATEGILLRRLQEDAALSDTCAVLMDEFHERTLDSDLLLGMLRRVQQALRDDLRIIIMSATLASSSIAEQLGNAPVVRVESPNYPVAIRYVSPRPNQHLADQVSEAIADATEKMDGDLLAFLPGAGEIHRCMESLQRTRLERECSIVPLYGAMTLEEQTRAIQPGDRRRIVLATNVAETSLTIEGIRIVVDSGMARVMRFSPEVGLDRLALEPISAASAAQRAGRAGRVAPGTCIRLWSEASQRARAAFLEPEIRRVDIVSAILQLYAWGEGESSDFPWLEVPRETSVDAAKVLLSQLGAIQQDRITEIGKQMAKLPTHPRLARMLIEAYEQGCLRRACLLASLLSERDPFDRRVSQGASRGSIATRASHSWDSDCIERVLAIEQFQSHRQTDIPFGTLQRHSLKHILHSAEQLQHQFESMLGASRSKMPIEETSDTEPLMRSLLAGFPDRLAKRRQTGKPTGLMVGGKGVVLSDQSGVSKPELFLCIDIQAEAGDALVRQASRVDFDWLDPKLLVTRDDLFYHPTQKQVIARRRTLWQDLVLSETPTAIEDDAACAEILWQVAVRQWEQAFPTGDEAIAGLVERVHCLRQWLPDVNLPALDESVLHDVARELCQTRRSLAELRAAPWLDWIQSKFTSEQWQWIEREAPARIQVPSGSWIKVHYERNKPPTMSVKIQEVFSLKSTPRIAMGRIPILLQLLSPAMRPQQITDDLASFWANGYPIIKKELKRRYPKHSWPDDPTTAAPGRK